MADEQTETKPTTVKDASKALLDRRFENFTNRLNNTRSIASARKDLARMLTASNAKKEAAR